MADIWMRRLLDREQYATIMKLEKFLEGKTIPGQTQRLRDFTLHGPPHWKNVEKIMNMILAKYKGVRSQELINGENCFLLLCSIYLHDITMFEGIDENVLGQFGSLRFPSEIANVQRKYHNELIYDFIRREKATLHGAGINETDLHIIREICQYHTHYDLNSVNNPLIRALSVILRISDELDILPSRAPIDYFKTNHANMDKIAQRHWAKHIVTLEWRENYNVYYTLDKSVITFKPVCRPPGDQSMVDFILKRIMEPIESELTHNKLAQLLLSQWNIKIVVEPYYEKCKPEYVGECESILNQIITIWKKEFEKDTAEQSSFKPSEEGQLFTYSVPVYSRASENVLAEQTSSQQVNQLGIQLLNLFGSELGAIPSSRENKERLLMCWSPPITNDNVLTRKYDMDISVLQYRHAPLFDPDWIDTGLESQQLLGKLALSFCERAQKTRFSNDYIILFGERGSGKTTTLNAIFTGSDYLFRSNNIFWLRICMMNDVGINGINEKDIQKKAAEKFVRVLFDESNSYFTEFKQKAILKREYFSNQRLMSLREQSESFWQGLRRWAAAAPVKFMLAATKIMFQVGYRFIFIFDNLDIVEDYAHKHHESEEWIRARVMTTLSVAVTWKIANIPSLTIIATRGNTVNRYLSAVLDSRILSENSLRCMNAVNSDDVLKRRWEYIDGRYKSRELTYVEDGKETKVEAAEKLIKFLQTYLISTERQRDKISLVSGISGDNVVDLLEITKVIMSTHLLRSDELISAAENSEVIKLKNHMLLWAAMLPFRRKYYVCKPNLTFIFNIYNNYNDYSDYRRKAGKKSSLLLKRVLLQYFHSFEDKLRFNSASLYDKFVTQLKFDQMDLEYSLRNLNQWGLIYKYKDAERLDLFAITKKGRFFREYIQNQYIYHELVLEDTPVPLDMVNRFSLFEYNPAVERQDYFKKKYLMVRSFVNMLADMEKEELEQIGKADWFDGFKIFPTLKNSLCDQEKRIAIALNINVEDWV